MKETRTSTARVAALVGLAVGAFGAGNAAAQCTPNWQTTSPASPPMARSSAPMVFDAARGTVLLAGGYGPQASPSNLSDTWEWTGNNAGGGAWAQRMPALSPPARFGRAMAFDSARGVAVLFAGSVLVDYSNDLWEWNGAAGAWTERTIASPPPGRDLHALAYDEARHVVVLFGGEDISSFRNDTWEYDGAAGAWTQRAPAVSPSPRFVHAMAYDRARAVVVLFGGAAGSFPSWQYFDETWEWNGAAGTWTLRTPAVRPPARAGAAMAYDSDRQRIVMFGGSSGVDPNPVYFSDLWEWDGAAGAWSQPPAASPPAARSYAAASYDAAHHATVVFGGFSNYGGTVFGDTTLWACPQAQPCYANCDGSSVPPILNVTDFICFLNAFGAGDPYANCDGSSVEPILNVTDFICFQTKYAQGCP